MISIAKYIKDVFNIDNYIKNGVNKIFLISGVCSGKSSWVKEVLTQKGSVLFVTSRKAKVEADIGDSTFTDVINWFTHDNQTLVTNAGLARRIENTMVNSTKDLDDFINHFDYIVIDEVHSLATDSTFAESCQTVLSFIEYVAEKGKPIVCMTGTPAPIYYYFQKKDWLILNFLNTCNYVHPSSITMIMSSTAIKTIQKECAKNKVVYFANRTDTIVKMCNNLMKNGVFESAEIAISVSKSREKDFFDILQKTIKDEETRKALKVASEEAYNSIVNSKILPEKCRILFSTSTLKEGIDIKNKNIVMFCENHDVSSLIQYFGRAREGKTKVYIIEDSIEHSTKHDEFLYDYAIKTEVTAANEYIKEYIDKDNDPLAAMTLYRLKKKVEKNPYIFYDAINREFKVSHEKYNEEKRLLRNRYWKQDLLQHCFDYGIKDICFDYPTIAKVALHRMATKKDRWYETRIDLILTLLYWAYRIEKKAPKAINKLLDEANSLFRIVNGKGTKGEYRDKKYWQVLFVKDFAKL